MQLFWMMAMAFIMTFAFFLALGAFDPGEVLPWTLGAVGLAVLWVFHGLWMRRNRGGQKPQEEIRARERRGF